MNWPELSFGQRIEVRKLLENHIEKNIPGFEVLEKKQSLWMFLLSKILFFVPGFMTRFTTTFYPKVYVPSRDKWDTDPSRAIITLAHEYVHLRDRKRLGLFFNFLYMTPQILAVFALLYPYNNWFLLFLICLLPLPSFGRAWAEYRGYRMSMAVFYWIYGIQYNIEHIVYQFTSSNYYWMFPFRSYIRNKFAKQYEKIRQDTLSSEMREIKYVLTKAAETVYNNP